MAFTLLPTSDIYGAARGPIRNAAEWVPRLNPARRGRHPEEGRGHELTAVFEVAMDRIGRAGFRARAKSSDRRLTCSDAGVERLRSGAESGLSLRQTAATSSPRSAATPRVAALNASTKVGGVLLLAVVPSTASPRRSTLVPADVAQLLVEEEFGTATPSLLDL